MLGARGHGGFDERCKRFLLGSVAMAVVLHAPCSVEVVRESEPLKSTFHGHPVAAVGQGESISTPQIFRAIACRARAGAEPQGMCH